MLDPQTPPEGLTPRAAAEWARVAEELLKAGPLAPSAVSLLTAYAASWDRWRTAEDEVAKTSPVVRSPAGGAQANPWLAVGRAALRDARAALADLGLTAAAKRRAVRAEEEEGYADGDGDPPQLRVAGAG